jgi:hypothetical protein
MVLEDAEEDVEEGAYEDAVEDMEKQINSVERDFQNIKDEKASGNLKKKQEKAETILSEIHEQMDFLQEQVEKIDEDKKLNTNQDGREEQRKS